MDASFYNEEVRAGFTVPTDLKKIWAVELDLLQQFMSVCKKHNITYFLSGGTLLGAVRHKGFIPWDDDIDVVLMRDQYEKLLKVADKEFSAPYFLQSAYSDKGYVRGHAQLRNSNTTGLLSKEAKGVPFNQGIFIDIFPLDAVPDDLQIRKDYFIEIRKAKSKLDIIKKYYYVNPDDNIVKKVIKSVRKIFIKLILLYKSPEDRYRHFEEVCKKYNNEKTEFVGSTSFSLDDEKCFYHRFVFDRAIETEFENLMPLIPAEYDDMLRGQYGDYMVMKKENNYHGSVIFDTEMPYKDYIKNMK